MDKVSVIITAYNIEPYIDDCMKSVLAQTWDRLEIIVVDDASTDSTPRILEKYEAADPRVKLILLPVNSGQAAARNVALDTVTGRFVVMVDGDDTIHPRMISTLMENIGDADMIACDYFRSEEPRWPQISNVPVDMLEGPDAAEIMLYQSMHAVNPSQCAKLYKASLWDGVRFPSGKIYEDLAILPEIYLKAAKVAVMPLPLYHYRRRSGSTMEKFSLRRTDVLDVTESLCRDLPTDALRRAASDRALSAAFNILRLLTRNGYAASPDAARCWEIIRRNRRLSSTNSRVRMKNRIAAALSYLTGRRIMQALMRLV